MSDKVKYNYIPGSMSFASGFLGPRGDVGYFMEADQDKAFSILKDIISSGRKIESAEMGLDGDWDRNSCEIFDGEKFHNYHCYKKSQWAEPIMIVKFSDSPSETYSVWKRVEK